MEKKIIELKKIALELIEKSSNENELRELEIRFLGRKGELTEILKGLSSLPKDEIPKIGKLGNEIKNEILEKIGEKSKKLKEVYFASLKEKEWIDVSQPSIRKIESGKRHPLSKFIEEIVLTFSKMGFSVAEGDEIESQWYNFTALNLDPDHPAREMQATFFVKDLRAPKNPHIVDERDMGLVLRTQTSDVQIHYMQSSKPPIAVIAPGKVFRKDSDATHSPMFHQCEGLFIDKNVSLGHLKYTLLTALKEILNDKSLDLRFRLSYFPFTEPSMELDVTCPICNGKDKGCKVCKGGNWLEIGGCGMVHPNVLKNGGIDSKKYNGFAFGIGIDRLTMIKHKINDLRLFFENDLRFLKQF